MYRVFYRYWDEQGYKQDGKEKTFKTIAAVQKWYNKMLFKYGKYDSEYLCGFTVYAASPEILKPLAAIDNNL